MIFSPSLYSPFSPVPWLSTVFSTATLGLFISTSTVVSSFTLSFEATNSFLINSTSVSASSVYVYVNVCDVYGASVTSFTNSVTGTLSPIWFPSLSNFVIASDNVTVSVVFPVFVTFTVYVTVPLLSITVTSDVFSTLIPGVGSSTFSPGVSSPPSVSFPFAVTVFTNVFPVEPAEMH